METTNDKLKIEIKIYEVIFWRLYKVYSYSSFTGRYTIGITIRK